MVSVLNFNRHTQSKKKGENQNNSSLWEQYNQFTQACWPKLAKVMNLPFIESCSSRQV
jgi:hypothetical protein